MAIIPLDGLHKDSRNSKVIQHLDKQGACQVDRKDAPSAYDGTRRNVSVVLP